MMEEIRLIAVEKENGTIKYNWTCSDGLKKYFTQNDFIIEYPENVEEVPDGVLVIPFAAAALPISWLTDCSLHLPELDRDFFDSVPKIKDAFAAMYPEAHFGGRLFVDTVTDNVPRVSGGTAAFFSGGIDATTTLLRHIEEKPALLSLWGADVAFDNTAGWSIVDAGIAETAKQYGLAYVTIHTMFRNFEDVMALTADFRHVLHTTWWYGIKHGIGIISHAAPYAWLHGIKAVYIASSDCEEDGPQQCASYPTIDNNVAYCGCRTVHDGFELNRQDKTKVIVDYHRSHSSVPVAIRACWKSTDGRNCCRCEKCYRTMSGFWAEGEDPREYGFDYPPNAFRRMYQTIALHADDLPAHSWTYIKRRFNNNWDNIQDKPYAKKLKWMKRYDFFNLSENSCRKKYLRTWKVKSQLVKAFPKMYKLYIKLRGYSFE